MNTKSIVEMSGGAFIERIDYAMSGLVANILDENTPASKPRKLVVEFTLTPDADRTSYRTDCKVTPKPQPTNPMTTTLYATCDEQGQLAIVELTPQIPGQMDITGDEQAQPVLLRIVGGN